MERVNSECLGLCLHLSRCHEEGSCVQHRQRAEEPAGAGALLCWA